MMCSYALRLRDADVQHKPTHVIHLAAMVGGLFKNMKYKVWCVAARRRENASARMLLPGKSILVLL